MRERLIGLDRRVKKDEKDGRPTLRRTPGNGDEKQDPDERPTIRRRELVE
jgi:hypothetical protein